MGKAHITSGLESYRTSPSKDTTYYFIRDTVDTELAKQKPIQSRQTNTHVQSPRHPSSSWKLLVYLQESQASGSEAISSSFLFHRDLPRTLQVPNTRNIVSRVRLLHPQTTRQPSSRLHSRVKPECSLIKKETPLHLTPSAAKTSHPFPATLQQP